MSARQNAYYQEIRNLSIALSDNAVGKRRAALEMLGTRLGESRQQLVDAAEGNIIRKKEALTTIWRLILLNAHKCVSDLFAGNKIKPKASDVSMLATLVRQFLLMKEQLDPNITPVISSQVVANLLTLCLSNLEYDEEKAEGAEKEFLQLLSLICSRKEFVAFFGKKEISIVFSELDARLDIESDCYDHRIYDTAAKVWENFLTTLCQKVGVGMQRWMSECIELVSNQCTHHLKTNSTRNIPFELLKGAAILMLSHPEQAIEPLRRDGGSMLKLASRQYISSDANAKDTIIEYLHAHLRVCQVAGRLQGLLPGDLGDLDTASLDAQQTGVLLELIASDEEIEKIRASSVILKGLQMNVGGTSKMPSWATASIELGTSKKVRLASQCTSIFPRQRRHLELCARLLSISQRMYLSEKEWERQKIPIDGVNERNPLDFILNGLDFDDAPESKCIIAMVPVESLCSPSDYVRSPFSTRVLLSLCSTLPRELTCYISDLSSVPNYSQNTEQGVAGNATIHDPIAELSPALLQLAALCQEQSPAKSIIPALQVISTCAEAFPLGECWASQTHCYCYEGHKHRIEEDAFHAKRCSMDDLGLVVFVVSVLLESYGGAGSDAATQSWILRCLLRLTESTEMLTRLDGKGGSHGLALSRVWQRVWHLLFQPTLVYKSTTRTATCGSIGDLVLILLTEIVHRSCTNVMMFDSVTQNVRGVPTNAISVNQLEIWDLPIFKDSLPIETSSAFDLVSSVLLRMGVVETCPGTLNNVYPEILPSTSSSHRPANPRMQSLRYKLLGWCLGSAERLLQRRDLSTGNVFSKLSACIVALISGNPTNISTLFQCDTFHQEEDMPDDAGQDGTRFAFTTIRCVDPCVRTPSIKVSAFHLLSNLWNSTHSFRATSWHLDKGDVVKEGRQRALNMLFNTSIGVFGADFVSSSESETLRSIAIECVVRLIDKACADNVTSHGTEFCEQSADSSLEETKNAMSSLVYRLTWTKLLVALSVSTDIEKLFFEFDVKIMLYQIAESVKEFYATLPKLCESVSSFSFATESIGQLLRVWLMILASFRNALNDPRKALEPLANSLFDRCEDMLWNFHGSRLTGNPMQQTFVETKRNRLTTDKFFGSDSQESTGTTRRYPSAKENRSTVSSDESDGETLRRKRKRNSYTPKSSRRRILSTRCRPPNLHCAVQLANIAILLKPTYDCCNLVHRQISRLDAEEDNDANDIAHIDISGSVLLLRLLSNELPVLAQSRQEKSVVNIISQTIKEIRYCSETHSYPQLIGFEVIDFLLQNLSIDPDENSISIVHSRLIVESLTFFYPTEKRALKLRPYLTLKQQRAATQIFKSNADNIHKEFDQEFSRIFVKQYIGNLSEPVRLQAAVALGQAFRFFPEQNTIFRNVSDVLLGYEKNPSDDELPKIMDRSNRLTVDTHEGAAWKDVSLSWQSSSLLCWGIIGGTTTDSNIARKTIFDLVSVASDRPYFELICYKALQKIAQLRGFKDCDSLIRGHLGYLTQRWFETKKHLLDMPLLMTSPRLFDQLLKTCGQIRSFWPCHNEREDANCGFISFRNDVVRKFVTTNASSILSASLIKYELFRGTLATPVPSKSSLSEDPLMLVCQILINPEDEGTIGSLVNSHLGEILAFVIYLLQFEDNQLKVKATNVIQVLQECFGNCDERGKKMQADRSVRKLLQLIGSHDDWTGYVISSMQSFSGLLAKLGEIIMKKVVDPWVFLDFLNTNPLEYLLQARYWLCEGDWNSHPKRWKAVESIADTIFEFEYASKTSIKLFCLRVVLDILRDNKFIDIQVVVIEWLRKWNPEILALLKEESNVVCEVVGSLLHVHEYSQDAIIDVCINVKQENSSAMNRGNGVLVDGTLRRAHSSSIDTWGWDDAKDEQTDDASLVLYALQTYVAKAKPSFRFMALQTFDLINSILENMISTEVTNTFLLRNLGFHQQPHRRLQLREINLKYHAQSLLPLYLRVSENLDPEKSFQLAFESLKQIHSSELNSLFHARMKTRSASSIQLDLNSRFLVIALSLLQKSLQGCRKAKKAVVLDQLELVHTVIDIMVDKAYHEAVYLAASRVLGELDTTHMEHAPKIGRIAPWEWLEGADTDERSLMVSINARCMDQLAQVAISGGDIAALVAIEAMKALLATQAGISSFTTLKSSYTKDLFESFIQPTSTRKAKPTLITPPPRQLDLMQAFDNLEENDNDREGEWCWEHSLWRCTVHHEYDLWVKNIVGAMIWCCYSKSERHIKGKAMCFRVCLKMSLMEHTCAEALFPFIVLDLLLSAPATQPVPGFCVGDPFSAANQKLSECFDILLSCNPNTKAVKLLSESLEMLRRVNLHIFLGTKQIPNSNEEKADRKVTRPTDMKDASTNSLGVVLQIDPLKVLKAFVAAQQLSSAILFAESYVQAVIPNRSAETLPLLKENYLCLREYDIVEALNLQSATNLFLDKRYDFGSERIALADASERIQHLEAIKKDKVPAETSVMVIKCLDDLGLGSVMTAFIDKISRENQGLINMTQADQRFIKEMWSKMNLNARLWNYGPGKDLLEPQMHIDSIGSVYSDDLLNGAQSSGFYHALLTSLAALDREDSMSMHHTSVTARMVLIKDFASSGQEIILEDLALLTDRLKVFNELDTLINFDDEALHLLKSWNSEVLPTQYCHAEMTSTSYPELSFMFRELAIRILHQKSSTWKGIDLDEMMSSHLKKCLSLGRTFNSPLSEGSLKRLKRLIELSPRGMELGDLITIRYEEVLVLENQGHFNAAIQGVKLIVSELESQFRSGDLSSNQLALRADAMLTCGLWMKKYKVASAKHIQEAFLVPAASHCRRLYNSEQSRPSASRAFEAHIALAETSATLYEHASIRVKSREWRQKLEFLKSRTAEYQLLKSELQNLQANMKSGTKRTALVQLSAEASVLQQSLTSMKRKIGVLEAEKNREEDPINGNLKLALEQFGLALSISLCNNHDSSSGHVFRIISLWFDSCQERPLATKVIVNTIEEIPSFRFVPLTYQIFSRIDKLASVGSEFQKVLERLVTRMCNDHPYHCLPQLLALCNGSNGNIYLDAKNTKLEAAQSVRDQLRNTTNEVRRGLVESYAVLTDTYIALALAPTVKFTERKQQRLKDIPLSEMTTKGKARLDRCLDNFVFKPCILTLPPILQPDKAYGSGLANPQGSELIARFKSHVSITETGAHRPKIVICIGNSGCYFKQLVKGYDDIRQDAVMQQIFRYVNSLMKRLRLLSSGKKSGQFTQKLQLVTYNIVPLNPNTGILEWVENTIPFGDYLLDRGKKPGETAILGAHSRYFPGEWGYRLCRMKLAEADATQKRQVYDTLCHNFSPAFRFFFVERFISNLQEWHSAKTRYTRSCAVSSIVGHMLGIGDRHAQNILIHQKTGEVVHIDFGIVFEQGRELPTPETVPFRLTRDIVDGMGPTETAGAFSRAAEETTRVLRKNSKALLTILSAIVADPLYKWKESAEKARQRQQQELLDVKGKGCATASQTSEHRVFAGDDITDECDAGSRAISKIHEKLQGFEEGTDRKSVV